MKFSALALDYDGTIAVNGVFDPAVREAVGEARRRGIIVILGARSGMRKRYADHYGMPVERVFIVPKNRYMKRGHALRKD